MNGVTLKICDLHQPQNVTSVSHILSNVTTICHTKNYDVHVYQSHLPKWYLVYHTIGHMLCKIIQDII